MEAKKKWYHEFIYKTEIRATDVENKLMVSRVESSGERKGINWESGIDNIHYYI